MAKKRDSTKRRTAGSSRRRASGRPLLKIIISMMLLMVVVVLAAVAARWMIPASPRSERAALPPALTKPVPAREKPTYEIFPPQPAAPPKPQPQRTPPPDGHTPLVAIIVDDIGYDRRIADQLLGMDIPLTFSILPYGPFNDQILAAARAKGIEVMLHLPMEPDEYPTVNPGPGALLDAMSADELIARLDENLALIPGISGVNNHMGSRISASPERMRQIFSVLKKRGLFYIDSRTTAETVARSSAQLFQLPFAERDIFIDHLDDPKFIDAQLQQLIKRAKKQGFAVGIAHPHAATVTQLKAFLPRLKAEVNLVSASQMVQNVMIAEAEKLQTAQKKQIGYPEVERFPVPSMPKSGRPMP